MNNVVDSSPVDCVSHIGLAEFRGNYVTCNRPLLIEGAVAHWDALTLWTNAYLDAWVGHNRVDVETSQNQFEGRLFDDAEKVWMPFSRFLQRFNQDEGKTDYYVGSWLFPSLAKDISEIPIFEAFDTPVKRRMIMSRGGNSIALHNDWYQNILCQIAGRKHLVLADVCDSPFLYRLDDRINYSPIDLRAVDWQAYPKFRNARLYTAELNPGDALYIPCKWWHSVESFDRNIMISQSFYDTDEDMLCIVKKMLARNRLALSPTQAANIHAVIEQYPTAEKQVKAIRKLASAESLISVKEIFQHRRLLLADYATSIARGLP